LLPRVGNPLLRCIIFFRHMSELGQSEMPKHVRADGSFRRKRSSGLSTVSPVNLPACPRRKVQGFIVPPVGE